MGSRYVVLILLNLHLKHKPQKKFDVVFIFLAVVLVLRYDLLPVHLMDCLCRDKLIPNAQYVYVI